MRDAFIVIVFLVLAGWGLGCLVRPDLMWQMERRTGAMSWLATADMPNEDEVWQMRAKGIGYLLLAFVFLALIGG